MTSVGTSGEVSFGPAASRPVGYPDTLPFIPHREVVAISRGEYTAFSGARWMCEDPDILFRDIIAACVADGWRVDSRARRHKLCATADVVLSRSDIVRRVNIARLDTLALVELRDFPLAFVTKN